MDRDIRVAIGSPSGGGDDSSVASGIDGSSDCPTGYGSPSHCLAGAGVGASCGSCLHVGETCGYFEADLTCEPDNKWHDDPPEVIREVDLELEVQGDDANGYLLVIAPAGCFAADHWYRSHVEARRAASEKFSLSLDGWIALASS
jgi:hypothetical protein